MILLEKRKAVAECRKSFMESVYGEGVKLYESVFTDPADFEAFMNTLVKPVLDDGWQLSGDVAVDDEGVTHDDIILYKENEDGEFCVISASLIDGRPFEDESVKYQLDCSMASSTEMPFASDLESFIPVYNDFAQEEAGKAFGLGTGNDPLKALISFVGRDASDKNTLRAAIAQKMRDERENKPEMAAEPEEVENAPEANNEEEVHDVDELITDEVKKEAEDEMNSWLA